MWKPVAADDEETIQYKLDEAILKEIPRLEYGHSVIKLFAAIGPMLGLLGTVTGMMKTTRSDQYVGGGDPKLMAAGIFGGTGVYGTRFVGGGAIVVRSQHSDGIGESVDPASG